MRIEADADKHKIMEWLHFRGFLRECVLFLRNCAAMKQIVQIVTFIECNNDTDEISSRWKVLAVRKAKNSVIDR